MKLIRGSIPMLALLALGTSPPARGAALLPDRCPPQASSPQCTCPPCRAPLPVKVDESHGWAVDLGDPQHWFAATEAEVENARCRKYPRYSLADINAELTKKAGAAGYKENRSIHGIQFHNESPVLLDLFDKLTTAAPTTKDGHNIQQAIKASGCDKVMCAVRKIFGSEEGPRLVFMLEKFGFNGSHLAYNPARPWRKDYLDTLLAAMGDYPSRVFPLEENKQLVLSADLQPTSTNADASITIMNAWEGYSQPMQEEIIFHELGHQFGNLRGGDRSAAWRNIRGPSHAGTVSWISDTTGKTLTWGPNTPANNPAPPFPFDSGSCPSVYAMTHEDEDFAESCVAYRFKPDDLRLRSPERYNYLKEFVFDGVEYTADAGCQEDQSITAGIIARSKAALASSSVPPGYLDAARKACGLSMLSGLHGAYVDHTSLPEGVDQAAFDCISRSLTKSAALERIRAEAAWCPGHTEAAMEARIFPPEAPAAAVKAVLATLRPEITGRIRAMVENQEQNYGGSIKVPRPDHPKDESICDQWTSFPIQNMDSFTATYTSTLHDQLAMPSVVGSVMGDICAEGYKGYKKPAGAETVNMSASRRDAAIKAVMPVTQ